MSYADNIESALKNLESGSERDPEQARRDQGRKDSERARQLAAAPFAEELKKGRFTSDLLSAATRIGFGMRTKVQMSWIGPNLRLDARQNRVELRPTPEGVVALYCVDGKETGTERVNLQGNAEEFARRWLTTLAE